MSSLHVGTITFDWYLTDARVIRMVEAAAEAGCKVDVICLRHPGQKRYEVCDGSHVYRVPMSRGFGRPLLVNLLCWCWFLLLAGVRVTRLHLRHPYEAVFVANVACSLSKNPSHERNVIHLALVFFVESFLAVF